MSRMKKQNNDTGYADQLGLPIWIGDTVLFDDAVYTVVYENYGGYIIIEGYYGRCKLDQSVAQNCMVIKTKQMQGEENV